MPLRLKIPAVSRPVEVFSERPARPEVPLYERLAVSIPEFGELVGVSPPTVRAMLKSGLPHVRTSAAATSRVLIVLEPARRWLADQVVSLSPGTTDRPSETDDATE